MNFNDCANIYAVEFAGSGTEKTVVFKSVHLGLVYALCDISVGKRSSLRPQSHNYHRHIRLWLQAASCALGINSFTVERLFHLI